MLSDTYSETEVIRLLEKYFEGTITHNEFINYNPGRIIRNFFLGTKQDIKEDTINEFEQFISYSNKGKKK